MVAMILFMVAAVLLFLVQDRTDSFSGFLDGQKNDAECSLARTQYETQRCGGDGITEKEEFLPDNSEELGCNPTEWQEPNCEEGDSSEEEVEDSSTDETFP